MLDDSRPPQPLDSLPLRSRERIVMGALLLGVALIVIALMSLYGMNVNGRHVFSNPFLSIGALVLAAVTLIGCVWFAVRLLGRTEGFKVIRRELGGALWAGGVTGVLGGFIIRAVFSGPTVWVGFLLAYAAAVAGIWFFATRQSA